MRLLLTNDDGFDAPGLRQLIEVAREFGEVVVAAPAQCWSGCGHRIRTDGPIEVDEVAPGEFRIHSYPADCVRLAIAELVGPVDRVLAGINDGGNLGADVHVSGTVAAAREAALFRIPAVALSQYRAAGGRSTWDDSGRLVRRVLREILEPIAPGELLNVNLPDLAHCELGAAWHDSVAIVPCPVDSHPLPYRYRREGNRFRYAGDYHGRERHPESDVARCFGGAITLTRFPVASDR
ncbi:MAG TPA: 5'/3'-nucleotidase SurE [Pirellulaceae bacterium]|nr:5'/3'-nucleotidase SurE [Pirellulaceae bacterium]